jgi:hypothetical protein
MIPLPDKVLLLSHICLTHCFKSRSSWFGLDWRQKIIVKIKNLSCWHFVMSTFCHVDILLHRHFVVSTFCHVYNLSCLHFVMSTYILSCLHTFCHVYIHFVMSTYILSCRHFVILTVCHVNILSCQQFVILTVCHVDILSCHVDKMTNFQTSTLWRSARCECTRNSWSTFSFFPVLKV